MIYALVEVIILSNIEDSEIQINNALSSYCVEKIHLTITNGV